MNCIATSFSCPTAAKVHPRPSNKIMKIMKSKKLIGEHLNATLSSTMTALLWDEKEDNCGFERAWACTRSAVEELGLIRNKFSAFLIPFDQLKPSIQTTVVRRVLKKCPGFGLFEESYPIRRMAKTIICHKIDSDRVKIVNALIKKGFTKKQAQRRHYEKTQERKRREISNTEFSHSAENSMLLSPGI